MLEGRKEQSQPNKSGIIPASLFFKILVTPSPVIYALLFPALNFKLQQNKIFPNYSYQYHHKVPGQYTELILSFSKS